MELEHRVEKLEEELKVLKNQIQNTLLDIQEQIVSHNYPYLRSNEASKTQANSVAPQNPTNGQEEKKSTTEDAAAPFRAKALSLRDMARPPDPVVSQVDRVQRADDEKRPNLTGFMAVVHWMNATVLQIGREYTRRALDSYAERGHLAPQVASAVFQLLSRVQDEEPLERVGIAEILDALIGLNQVLGLETPVDIQEALIILED